MIDIDSTVKGKFHVQLKNAETGEIKFDSEFKNTILDNLFTQCINGGSNGGAYHTVCHAGTDSTVSITDTTITTLGTTSSVVYSNSGLIIDGTMVSIDYKAVYTFGVGAIVGNVSSIGLRQGSTVNATTLIIKSLIKDVNGDPTTITATANDQLIVTHTLTHTVDSKPAAQTLVVDGTTHTVQFATRLLLPDVRPEVNSYAPYAFHSGTATTLNYVGGAAAASAVMPVDGDVSSVDISQGISMTNSVQLGVGISHDGSKILTEGKISSTLTCTMAANTVLSGNAAVGFVGFGHSTSYTARTYNGFWITPALPKDNTVAYTFKMTMTLARG